MSYAYPHLSWPASNFASNFNTIFIATLFGNYSLPITLNMTSFICYHSLLTGLITPLRSLSCLPTSFISLLTTGGLQKWQFCHRLVTELSLLSFLCVTEVTELSFLHMFFGAKLSIWQLFVYHQKSAIWNPLNFGTQLGNDITFTLIKKTGCPLICK